MRLLLCWAVIVDSLRCSTCTRPRSSSCSATACMESVVPDGWSSPVPYASHKAGHRALSSWVLRKVSHPLRRRVETGKVLRRKKETGKQLPLKWVCRPWWVTFGAPLSGEWQEEIQAPLIHLLFNGPATAPRIKCFQASFPPSLSPNATGTESRKWGM